jgi:hypothetical protein
VKLVKRVNKGTRRLELRYFPRPVEDCYGPVVWQCCSEQLLFRRTSRLFTPGT